MCVALSVEPFNPQTKPNVCSSHSPPPTHQSTQADRVRDGQAKPAQCYIDGVASSLPTLYIEKSGAQQHCPFFDRDDCCVCMFLTHMTPRRKCKTQASSRRRPSPSSA